MPTAKAATLSKKCDTFGYSFWPLNVHIIINQKERVGKIGQFFSFLANWDRAIFNCTQSIDLIASDTFRVTLSDHLMFVSSLIIER